MSADRGSAVTDAEGNELGKIFIGGLSQVTNEASLRAYFQAYGQIEDAVVMMDNQTGRSRGFGFVKFKDISCVEAVLQRQDHVIDNKAVDVKQSNIHVKGKAGRNLKIFVGGIAPEHDARVMQNFFSQYGKVAEVNLMLDQSKQRHRGFAFVTFDDERVVQRLVQLHFVNINGRVVEIKAMRPASGGAKEPQCRQEQQAQCPVVYHHHSPAPAPLWHPMALDPGMQVAWAPPGWGGQQWCSPQVNVVDNCWPQALVTWPGMMPAGPLLQPLAWDCGQRATVEQSATDEEAAMVRSQRQSASWQATPFKESAGGQQSHAAAGDFDQQAAAAAGVQLQRQQQ